MKTKALIGILALCLCATQLLAEDIQPQTARGSISSATGVVVTPSGKFTVAQIWLGGSTSPAANLSWAIYRQTCVDCDPEPIKTGVAADLPVTYGGRKGYSYSIVVTTYVAGSLYYRVVSE